MQISILEAKVGNKRKELVEGEIPPGKHAEEIIVVDDEHQTWSFNGEWWRD